MRFLGRNELGMMRWQWNDGMRFKWHEWPLDEWNGIQMTEWHSNDRMTFKWWNDTRMRFSGQNELGLMDWQGNDGIRFKLHEYLWMNEMASKWQNDFQLTEWNSNDGMPFKWFLEVKMS